MIRATLLALALGLAWLTAPDTTHAQTLLGTDQNRPTGTIAADLGGSEQTFISCLRNVTPDGDHARSGATQRASEAVFLACLQTANPDITNDKLGAVMDRHRPEGANG